MRVLVTGGAGFVGSNVVDALVARGDSVVVVDDLSTGTRANLTRGELRVADISDPDALERAVARERFDAVVHAAAEARVTVSVSDPARSERINVGGTRNVLGLATRVGARRFVFFSTGGALYGETATCATEQTPTRPLSPYGKHKLAAEGLVRASGLSHAILRPANIYGPRQRGDLEAGVIAIFIHRFRTGEPLVVFGDGTAERDYIYVADVAGAVGAALDSSRDGTWNVGTGVPTSVNGLIGVLRRRLGEPKGGVRYAPPREGELQRACVDASKAKRDGLLGRLLTLEEGIGRLLDAPSQVA